MVGCDLQRPAAVEQLIQLGKELNIEVYNKNNENSSPVLVAKEALKYAKEKRMGLQMQ